MWNAAWKQFPQFKPSFTSVSWTVTRQIECSALKQKSYHKHLNANVFASHNVKKEKEKTGDDANASQLTKNKKTE